MSKYICVLDKAIHIFFHRFWHDWDYDGYFTRSCTVCGKTQKHIEAEYTIGESTIRHKGLEWIDV